MLTDTQAKMMCDLLLLRADEYARDDGVELWAGLADEDLPEVHDLWVRGFVQRRWSADKHELQWRASDAAVSGQELGAILAERRAALN